MKDAGLPKPEEADNDRLGGAQLLYNLMLETKRIANGTWQGGDILLVSGACPQLLESIPALMRDPHNLDDVLKTDKGQARLEQDCYDAFRYGAKSMLAPNQKVPIPVQAQQLVEGVTDRQEIAMRMRVFEHQVKKGLR